MNSIKTAIKLAEPFDPWLKPDMSIIDGGRRQPPPLPMECFRSWEQWILDRAESRSAPPDYIAASLLSVASGLIGNSRWVSPWGDWAEPPSLWIACIGNPSSGKSPALDVILSSVRTIENEMSPDFEATLLDYERDKEAARIKRESWQDEVRDAVKLGAHPPDIPAGAMEPDKPNRPRFLISDTSVEQLAKLLSTNVRGLTFHRDELSGWLGNMGKYGGDGDRSFWIEAFGGRGYTVDRVKYGGDPILVPYTTASIIGGIQPDRLASLLMKGDDDGLASRFLMVWPNSVIPKRPTSGADGGKLDKALSRLSGLVMPTNEDSKPVPSYITLDEDAADLFQEWRASNAVNEGSTSGLLTSHMGKLPGIVLRLALVLEYLEWAATGGPEPAGVSKRSIGLSAHLADEYFIPMASRAYGDASLPTQERHGASIARRILKERPPIVNARIIRREWGLPGLKEARAVREAVSVLVDGNWLQEAPTRVGNTPGQQKADYKVNPKLWGAVK